MTSENQGETTTPITGMGKLRPGTLEVVLAPDMEAQNVHKLLEVVFNLHGCTACGLNGLDLRLRPQDSIMLEKFRDIEGVKDVNIYR